MMCLAIGSPIPQPTSNTVLDWRQITHEAVEPGSFAQPPTPVVIEIPSMALVEVDDGFAAHPGTLADSGESDRSDTSRLRCRVSIEA